MIYFGETLYRISQGSHETVHIRMRPAMLLLSSSKHWCSGQHLPNISPNLGVYAWVMPACVANAFDPRIERVKDLPKSDIALLKPESL